MESLIIHTESKDYPVVIGYDVIHKLRDFLIESQFSKVLIITDTTLEKLHLSTLQKELIGIGIEVFVVPSGESAKTFEVFYQVQTYALQSHLDRNSVIVAFGGGAVGDMAGFVAATYMRGIPFIQVPTTILAHDSAVGGKVAINHELGKNMIGSFYQPEAVFYDMRFLETLPKQEVRSGFAEIIKHALISDKNFYHWLMNKTPAFSKLSNKHLENAITMGVKIKGNIVSKDEKETGIRAFLNFGHTLGHAIEAEMGYGKISHGEAVVIGMVFALQISQDIYELEFELDTFTTWLEGLGYTTKIPIGLSPSKLLVRMKGDKKAFSESVRFVLLKEIGNPGLKSLTDEYLLEKLNLFMEGERI
ncbi:MULTISPECIES: 3-dehydroquinate synthase [unclassified Bacillus (in: firmicutes)]|uniref:3-dehydroquinate synthase n=1 Tax=unclassified Bacillus (in: firmicutes) TaxID=185979 RepID=UPI0008E98E23|nr:MULTISPECIES: 3-dehydroquinate synthase [unclassified Bacillus (in: firmicutes)]SFA98538.1 3-dehydroquinate synthase [Bacillus sp. UNCCL13]SFQ81110.1 3-dehydroquinate synthase [Bacillus sp. cl95]